MEIKVIATGSTGNCYVLEHNGSSLVIEAGIPFKKLSKAMNYKANSADGVLISHEHGDHAGYIEQYLKKGLNCYASLGTIKTLQINHHNLYAISPYRYHKTGTWLIEPFVSCHDTLEPFGFMIKNEKEEIVYLTDTGSIPDFLTNTFKGITRIMIECNYCDDIMENSRAFHASRSKSEHLGLNAVRRFMISIDKSELKEVILIHLSDSHSDEDRMVSEVQQITGPGIIVRAG